ncbi:hypothetical protein [Coprococcus eutactus]|uniref:hypothetical protein n=1 Tax=Coprococcus eutactus TaxID=33043 RepID=UPI0006C1509F|nr:hypothetical protein [Coprococcus eutactus]CUN01606.1 Uncharacterised protein [Coprococcus eutactus]
MRIIVDASEITIYPTVSSVGMEDRKKYTRTQTSSKETVCSTCGMKYDRKLYKTCPLCESRKKNLELEKYLENIKTENARLNKEICKTERKQESNINDSKREVGKATRDNKGELQSKELSVSEFKKSIDYKIVVNRAYFKEKEEGNVSDDFIQSELDKLIIDKKCIGKITVEDVRNDIRNLTKRQADKKMTTDSVVSEKNDSKRDVGKTPRDNKGELQSKELSVSEFKKSIDYKIVVNRAYFKEKEEGSVSDDFIQSELDKLRLDKKFIGEVTVEDVRNDMRILIKRQADKKIITDTVVSEKNAKNEGKEEIKNVAQSQVKGKNGKKKKVDKIEKKELTAVTTSLEEKAEIDNIEKKKNKRTKLRSEKNSDNARYVKKIHCNKNISQRIRIVITISEVVGLLIMMLISYTKYYRTVELKYKWLFILLWILGIILSSIVFFKFSNNCKKILIGVAYWLLQLAAFVTVEIVYGSPFLPYFAWLKMGGYYAQGVAFILLNYYMNMTEEEKYQDSITMTMIVFFESIAIITIFGKLFFDMFDN